MLDASDILSHRSRILLQDDSDISSRSIRIVLQEASGIWSQHKGSVTVRFTI